jgi:hypothetical protein
MIQSEAQNVGCVIAVGMIPYPGFARRLMSSDTQIIRGY